MKKEPTIHTDEKVLLVQKNDKVSENISKIQPRTKKRLQHMQNLEAIATLAGGIAHAFNNALSVINGHIDLLEIELRRMDAGLKSLTAIKGATCRMAHLTSQLLAYARDGDYQVKRVSANDLITETLHFLGHSLPERIHFTTEIADNLGDLHVDKTQMQMVLAAVINNAIEAMDANGRLHFSARNWHARENKPAIMGLAHGDYVHLEVKDNGQGMTSNVRRRIFEPFFSTRIHGRGLGMAAAYGIIKNHAGGIEVESTSGQGTTVHIYLPIVIPSPSARHPER